MLPLVPTLSLRAFPRLATWARHLALMAIGSLFLALMAQVRIPLPFTPVPLTGQTFAVLLIGATYGVRLGAATIALYLLEGALGLPFFAGGRSGLTALLGPTGGYLLGFVLAAAVTGALAERGLERSWRTSWLPFLLGNLAVYLIGLPWLAFWLGSWEKALLGGFFPFLLTDALKAAAAALVTPLAWQLTGSHTTPEAPVQ